MNAVTVQGLPKLPERGVMPVASERLSHAVWLVRGGHAPDAASREEAREMLTVCAPMFAAPKPRQVVNWLERVNLGTSQPIAPADFDIRAAVIADALGAFPAAAFTVETAREAALRFKWFPGAQEVAEYLAPRVGPVQALERQLHAVIRAPEPEPTRAPPTDEEKAAVAAILRSAMPGRSRHEFQEPARTPEEQIAALVAA